MPARNAAVRDAEFESMLANTFRKKGWRVDRRRSAKDLGVDLVLDRDGKKYIVELKVSSEGRRDRLIPLLSQAIIQAQAFVRHSAEPFVPVAVVAAERVPASVAEQIKQFAERYAPEVGVGVIDRDGLRSFSAHGLEELDAKPRRVNGSAVSPSHSPDLFSDLNQWMLKIFLGQYLPEALISVPRKPIRNASQLAEAANVSVMSASRLVNQLEDRGFLDKREDHLRIVRIEELLDLWIAANRDAAKEVPAHWIIKKGPEQMQSVLRDYASALHSKPLSKLPRYCLGLFSSADALGLGFVRGVPPHIYVERMTLDLLLHRLGLSVEQSNRPVDVYLRIPVHREAIFRASVERNDIAVSDVLQVWLDVSTHAARGREQAQEIWQRVLKPAFGKRR
jgi:hypothetical protein